MTVVKTESLVWLCCSVMHRSTESRFLLFNAGSRKSPQKPTAHSFIIWKLAGESIKTNITVTQHEHKPNVNYAPECALVTQNKKLGTYRPRSLFLSWRRWAWRCWCRWSGCPPFRCKCSPLWTRACQAEAWCYPAAQRGSSSSLQASRVIFNVFSPYANIFQLILTGCQSQYCSLSWFLLLLWWVKYRVVKERIKQL